jgi:hypothetical protein
MSDYPPEIEARMEQVIQNTMNLLYRIGGENTKLIVEQDTIGIEDALRNYRDQLVDAFNQKVLFNDDYTISPENMKNFLNVNLYDLSVLKTAHAPDNSTPRNQNFRAMQRTPRSFTRISNCINIIYSNLMELKNLEYRDIQ